MKASRWKVKLPLVLLAAALLVADAAGAERWRVGPGREYERPSAVAAVAQDGDVVEIDAGVYAGDVAVWRQNRLTLRARGGRVHLKADGRSAEGKAIWVIKGQDTTIEGIEFSGAAVDDGNGAGIRQEGADVAIRNCYFHHNQNGILGGAGHVLIEHSEFAHNGAGGGYTHNIYIGDRATRFTLRFSYSHHARVGHNVKSRARENRIEYSRIMDEAEGNASYAIDLPNGGRAVLIGNLIQQGPRAENPVMLSYGAEGLADAANELYVVHNTFVNDAHRGIFIRQAEGTVRALAINNLFVGPGRAFEHAAETRGNLSLISPRLVDRARYDYRLGRRSPAIDAGVDPGRVNGVSLAPTAQYVHPLTARPRTAVGPPDVGAYEFDGGVSNQRRQ